MEKYTPVSRLHLLSHLTLTESFSSLLSKQFSVDAGMKRTSSVNREVYALKIINRV